MNRDRTKPTAIDYNIVEKKSGVQQEHNNIIPLTYLQPPSTDNTATEYNQAYLHIHNT